MRTMSDRKLLAEKRSLLREGLKHRKNLVHSEFRCPICGGIATVATENFGTRVECHACAAWEEVR